MMEQQISSSDGGPEQQSDLHRAPDACERASLLVPYPPRPTCARYRNPWGVLHAEVGTSITDSWNSWFAPESEKVCYGTWKTVFMNCSCAACTRAKQNAAK